MIDKNKKSWETQIFKRKKRMSEEKEKKNYNTKFDSHAIKFS